MAFVLPIGFLTQLVFGFAVAVVPQGSPAGRVALVVVSFGVGLAIAHSYLAVTMLRAGAHLRPDLRPASPAYPRGPGGRSSPDPAHDPHPRDPAEVRAAALRHGVERAGRWLPARPLARGLARRRGRPRRAVAARSSRRHSEHRGGGGRQRSGVPGPGLPLFVGLFVLISYSTLLTIRRGRTNGQTFGKQLMGIASSARMATGGTGLIGRDEVTREATDPPERVADAALEAAKAEAQLLRVELSLCLVIVDLEEGERTEGAVAARGVENGLALLAELLARATIVARSLGKELQLVPVGAGQG